MKTYTPQNLNELVLALNEMTNKSKIVAGSTDLGIQLNKGNINPDSLLYMGYIKETKEILEKSDYIEIGAYVTHTELEHSPIVNKYCKAISDAAKDVGSLQIRNNGTIGGNIANASPAGDLLPVLFMLDAFIVLINKSGELKEVKISDFILGPGKTILLAGEAILKFKIMKTRNFVSAFVKLGSRKKLTISRIGCAIGIIKKENKIKNIKIYIGAISLKPVRLRIGESFLKDRNLDELISENTKEKISNFMSETIFEITPEKFDRDYKMWASQAVIDDLFNLLYKRVKIC